MTDEQILKKLEKQLNIKFEKVNKINLFDKKPCFEINNGNITGLLIRNVIIEDLSLISKLVNLEELYLSDNQIKNISDLKILKNISELDLSNNQIKDISFLQNLKNIKLLDLYSNQIKDISVLKNLLKKENSFDKDFFDFNFNLKNNPLKTPPKELAELGRDAINEYFEHIELGYTVLKEAKLIIIGEAGAGKTTFAKKLINANAKMPEQNETTLGIDVYNWQFETNLNNTESPKFNAKLWDFGGQDIYHGTHQFFFSQKSLYILISDARDQRTDFNYWLNTVEQLTGENSILLVLFNKREGRNWKLEDEYGLNRRFEGMIKKVISIDLSNIDEIPHLQQQIQKEITNLPQIDYRLPTTWVNIRKELSKLTDRYISYEKFRDICNQNNITNPKVIEIISKLFTNIGVFTHFIEEETNLQDIIFLDSNWLTKTVYSLLDNQIVIENKGKITRTEVNQILKTEELYFDVDKFIELLKKFSLIYKINGSQNYIVPYHLKAGQPYKKWKYIDDKNVYIFRYLFDNYMPKGIMVKLIVALHQYIYDHELVWARGVNISNSVNKPDTFAEIIETYGRENRFDIRIYGKNQKDLLQIIIYHFDKILKPFTKLTHEKEVPCNCETCITSDNPHFFKYKSLLKRKEKGKTTIECDKSFEDTNIKELLEGIDFSELRSLLINKKFEEFKQQISQRFSDISYQIHKKTVSESFFHSNFHTILAENGLKPISEESTNDGRIDLHLSIDKTKYLFELKLKESKDDGMKQIHEKKYYNKFLGQFDKIILIAISFSTKTRNIDKIEYEIL